MAELKTRNKNNLYLVQDKPCKSCPFSGDDSLFLSQNAHTAYLENLLSGGQHLCHSSENKKICRGGRDIQLKVFFKVGLLSAPTDEAFNTAVREAM